MKAPAPVVLVDLLGELGGQVLAVGGGTVGRRLNLMHGASLDRPSTLDDRS